MPEKTEKKKEAVKLEYEGKSFYLVGSEETKDEIITWGHTYQDGSHETIALRLDTPYQVGGKDACGTLIKDWVYDTYLTSDFNGNRKKSRFEEKADGNNGEDPTLDATLN